MNGANSRKARQFWNGPGFYAVLALLVTAIAVAGYWTLFPSHTAAVPTAGDAPPAAEQTAEPIAEPAPQSPAPVRRTEPEAPVIPAEPDEPAEPVHAAVELTVTPQPEAPVVLPAAPRLIVLPLEGETVAAFSVEQLQYNETLADWRTHDGVDIAAAEGSAVLAACSGTVARVWQDDLLGSAVLLHHSDGYETLYASLGSEIAVSEGEFVSAGQALGTVGTTALGEAALPAHLHFAVTRSGVPVDPQTFLDG